MNRNSALITALALATGSASAQFVSVADFEVGSPTWNTGSSILFSTTADPDNASNNVGSYAYDTSLGGGSSVRDKGWAWVPLGTTISSGTTTIFFQAYLPDDGSWDFEHTVNATDAGPAGTAVSTNVGWGDLEAIGRFGGGSGDFDVYDGNYTTATNQIDTGDWYNMWYVIDGTNETTDFYIQSADDSDFNTQTMVYNDAAWRDIDDPTNFLIKVSSSGGDALLIDNIFVDDSGSNLANPTIPEPTTVAIFIGLAGFGLALIRRRQRG